ncbi:MAG: hypothetical protein AAF645_04050 [Myxococcota bacterium]
MTYGPHALTALGALLCASSALAHGRLASTYDVVFGPGGPIFATTYGLVQRVDGAWRWRCTASMGRVPLEDPALVLAESGTLAATFQGLVRLDAEGCRATSLGEETERVMIDVQPDPAGGFWAVSSDGNGRDNVVYRSEDGVGWSAAGPPIEPILFETLVVGDANLHLSAVYPRTAERLEREIFVFHSTDGAATWQRYPFQRGDGERTLYLEGLDENGRLIGRVQREFDALATPERVVASADGGETWETLLELEGRIRDVALRPGSIDVAVEQMGDFDVDGELVRPRYGLFRSTDGGSTFAHLESGRSLTCAVANGSELWLCEGPSILVDRGAGLETEFTLADLVGPVTCPEMPVCVVEERDLICDNALELPIEPGCPDDPDAGPVVDGGTNENPGDGGGGCALGVAAGAAPLGVLLLAGVWLLRRRSASRRI